jgi:rubrerythrin
MYSASPIQNTVLTVLPVHHALFQKALEDLEGFPTQECFVCYACGYLATGEAPAKCPICGAVKKAFKKVE